MLIATAPEEFGLPECADTVEAAGLKGPHRWGVILPNKAIVRYMELATKPAAHQDLRCEEDVEGGPINRNRAPSGTC